MPNTHDIIIDPYVHKITKSDVTKACINPKMLKWARKHRHMSVMKASEKSMVGFWTIEAAEQGDAEITMTELYKIAEAYNFPISFFYLDHPPALSGRFRHWVRRKRVSFLKWLCSHWDIDPQDDLLRGE